MEIDTELPGGFIVHGSRPERWIRQTSLDNDEAVGYLADRLARLGVEEALAEAGVQPGAPVTIGDVTFDWEPSTPAGVGVLMSGRGTDRRLDQSARIPPTSARRPESTAAAPKPDEELAVEGPGRRAQPEPVTPRQQLAATRRIVVKVGSSSLTSLDGGLDRCGSTHWSTRWPPAGRPAARSCWCRRRAITAGLAPLGLTRRPRDLATQQAAASVGQLLLAHAYEASFSRHGQIVGQVLLTADDMIRRAHYRNVQRTLERLLRLDVLPVVNENDTVATDEIRVGDNDRLAALVAHLIGADALVLLSDVDGLCDGDPRKPGSRLLAEVDAPADLEAVTVARPARTGRRRGGRDHRPQGFAAGRRHPRDLRGLRGR